MAAIEGKSEGPEGAKPNYIINKKSGDGVMGTFDKVGDGIIC